MNSNTERGYGARIGNAQKLVQALESFSNYQSAKPELSIAGINQQIAAIQTLNNEVAAKKQAYSMAVENRLKVFVKNPDAIMMLLSPINANVKVIYGKNSKEASDVAHIIEKMRGNNIMKSNDSKENTISQSYQSFHSKIQFFADLVANISAFGNNYNPVNPKISVVSLKNIYNAAVAASNLIVESNAKFVLTNEKRINAYKVLSQNGLMVKESVKAQYGIRSSEYKLIRSLYI
jgi:hypothetical protein